LVSRDINQPEHNPKQQEVWSAHSHSIMLGRNKECTTSRAPDHWEAPNYREGVQKSQQCRKYFLQYCALASVRPYSSRAPNLFLAPGAI